MQYYLGLDIGTTSISLIVVDIEAGKTVYTETRQHESRILNKETDTYLLDSATLLKVAMELVDSAISQYPGIEGIGVTGQMHGVVLVDRDGTAVSPVYTWLDMRSTRPGSSGESYVSELESITGVPISPGYGGSTLYKLSKVNSIPDEAESFCTATDYVAMKLAGQVRPEMDPSLAHSLGYFDVGRNSFKPDLWKEITSLVLPAISESGRVIGRYRGRIPVVAAIGDNQASFLGSVRNPGCGILVNIGTSGQICFIAPPGGSTVETGLEVRPYPTGENFLVGASLTGGKSFDVLANLIADAARLLNSSVDPYEILVGFIQPPESDDRLHVETTFKGTRRDPSKTGSITGISLDNLTIERLYWAFARGVIDELYRMVEPGHAILANPDLYVVVSGNAVIKNRALGIEIGRHFQAPLMVPVQEESAALGAALISAAGICGDLDRLPDLVGRTVFHEPLLEPGYRNSIDQISRYPDIQ